MVPEYLIQVSYYWISTFMRVLIFNKKMDYTISTEETFKNKLHLVKFLDLFLGEFVNIGIYCNLLIILKWILIICMVVKINITSKSCIATINKRTPHSDNHNNEIPNKQQFIVFTDNDLFFENLKTCPFSTLRLI
jgi:hypothetical protein